MSRTMTWAFLAHFVSSIAAAQNGTMSTCSILGNLLTPNASITREIPAYSISKDVYLGDNRFPDPSQSFHLENDTSRRWSLSLRVHNTQPEIATRPDYQQTLLLDTVDSNVTRMGMCHQYIQAYDDRQGGFRWKKEVLERSLNDNGDCKTMLGNECVDALTRHYKRQAMIQLSQGDCAGTNYTMPTECEMLGTTVRNMNLTVPLFGGTSDPSIKCDGLNMSSTHGLETSFGMPYGEAIRFPLVDIITIWPNHALSTVPTMATEDGDTRVEIVCLRPDEVAQGSDVPASGVELLNKEGVKFLNVTNEDAQSPAHSISLDRGMLAWLSVGITSILLVL